MTGDVQRRVAEVLVGHPDWRYETVARGHERVVCWCGVVVREFDAPGRIVPQLAAHQAAVLAAEGLLAGDGPVDELAETDTTAAELREQWAAGEEQSLED